MHLIPVISEERFFHLRPLEEGIHPISTRTTSRQEIREFYNRGLQLLSDLKTSVNALEAAVIGEETRTLIDTLYTPTLSRFISSLLSELRERQTLLGQKGSPLLAA